jgi:release factor glutamine methyltransferase
MMVESLLTSAATEWRLSPRPLLASFASVTVLEVIQRSSEFLERKGVDSPRLQSELLLAHVLQLPRMKLYLNFERPLTSVELDAVRGLVKRRGQREPLQHIVGSTSFCGLEMKVSRDVLIPRPETELVAEHACRLLTAAAGNTPTALDFATGSGCLAIVMAVKCPAATVHATDVSAPALAIARENAARHEVAGRTRFHAGDGLAAVPEDLHFDVIVSNPPYIPSEAVATLQPEVRDHDPLLALDGGVDGLRFYKSLATGAAARLRPGGRLVLELGHDQAKAVGGLLAEAKWKVEGIYQDYAGVERILIARPLD